ncbi:MAG TPA: hypothetical protein VFV87_16630 [Pirellulaceae bacterium]|nr:hypothetical protein [Pirellulaceae bacterium]
MLAGTTAQEDLDDGGVFASILRWGALPQRIDQARSAGCQRTKSQKLPTIDVVAAS